MPANRDSVDSLITGLKRIEFGSLPSSSVGALLQSARLDHADLRPYLDFDDIRYTRNLIFRNDHFELLALCWPLGSSSAVHDHGGKQAYMTVHSGSLTFEDFFIMTGGKREGYAQVAPAASGILTPGLVDVRSSDLDLHRVSAPNERAISLHVYAKPLDRYMVFNPETRSCRTVFAHYDSVPASPVLLSEPARSTP